MEDIGEREQQCLDLAAQIARELEFTKHTGWWCDGEVISEKSPWQVVMEGENREKQRRARRTKREMAQKRAEEEAERLRAQRARQGLGN
eukprot:5011818-Amphidinium_carterae.1